MSYLLPLSAFVKDQSFEEVPASYQYEGRCPDTGAWLSLPRTGLAEAVARGCMAQLDAKPLLPGEGKMYGVMVVETARGSLGVLRAFSGQLQGQAFVAGWVPPLPGHEHVALDEAETLAFLDKAKASLLALEVLPCFAALEAQIAEDSQAYEALVAAHKAAKAVRGVERAHAEATLEGDALAAALHALNQASYDQSTARRGMRRAQTAAQASLAAEVEAVRAQIRSIKRARKERSRQLQAQMHALYTLTNFAGQTRPLRALTESGNLPTGTGDCCAPKLLYFAATHGLKPLGMAEFWWGPPSPKGERQAGAFYGACEERCQPIMGFLLSGLPATPQAPAVADGIGLGLDVVYEDDAIIVVNKPSGLLSVPGRTSYSHDSVASRVCHLFPDMTGSVVVHRLDMNTSGLLVLARDAESHRVLSAAFKKREVEKKYVALVCGEVKEARGSIELPLWGDPDVAPRQVVDHEQGKACLTHYEVMGREGGLVRLLLTPHTGRTHQLRVHTSHEAGLGTPILGDRLYGEAQAGVRLHLHARDLCFPHPRDSTPLTLTCPVPF